jgi:hypothetical protein
MADQYVTNPPRQDPGSGGPPGEDASAKEQAQHVAGTAADQARNVGGTARDEARDVAGTAKDQARSVASTAKDEARSVAGTAQTQARRLAGDAKHELRLQAGAQVDRLAEGVDGLSHQLRSMATNGDQGPLTDLAAEAADRAQAVADRLRQGGFDETLSQVRSFGRNRPGLFLLGAFGLGLVAGRVARNLASDDPSSGNGDGNRSMQGTYSTPELAYTPEPASVGSTSTTYTTAQPGAVPDTGYGDQTSHTAYGAPVEPNTFEPPPPSVAPVGEERWAPVSDQRWGS